MVEEFREACGPADPEVAKALYPKSFRALLGVQQVSVRVVDIVDVDIVVDIGLQYVVLSIITRVILTVPSIAVVARKPK